MKRDMDLVRKILFAMEADDKRIEFTEDSPVKVEGYKGEVVAYHMKIMAQASLLHADLVESMTPIVEGMQMPKNEMAFYSLSWTGYEFLEASRDNTRWEKAKATMAKAGGVLLPVLTQLLTSYLKAELKLP